MWILPVSSRKESNCQEAENAIKSVGADQSDGPISRHLSLTSTTLEAISATFAIDARAIP